MSARLTAVRSSLTNLPRLLGTAAATLAFVASATASATPGITGTSGKYPNDPAGGVCTRCHSGGTPPTVTVTAPSTVEAGTKGVEVTINVVSSTGRIALNAAISNGLKVTAGQNMDIPEGETVELTHTPLVFNQGNADFKFTFDAPTVNRTLRVWVAAMANSGDGTGGDGVRVVPPVEIQVTGGGVAPPEEDSGTNNPGTDGGGSSGGDGGTSGGDAASNGNGNGNDDGYSDDELFKKDDGGCSMGAFAGGSGALGFTVALGLSALARRRRRR